MNYRFFKLKIRIIDIRYNLRASFYKILLNKSEYNNKTLQHIKANRGLHQLSL